MTTLWSSQIKTKTRWLLKLMMEIQMGLINFMANSILIIFFARVCMCVCVFIIGKKISSSSSSSSLQSNRNGLEIHRQAKAQINKFIFYLVFIKISFFLSLSHSLSVYLPDFDDDLTYLIFMACNNKDEGSPKKKPK